MATSFLQRAQLKWAAGGWAFFIAENAILSENRTWLIERLGDDQYHALYGTFSTAAMVSIGYSYRKLSQQHQQQALSLLWKTATPPPVKHLVASWGLLSLGLIMASQSLPKIQIPVTISKSNPANHQTLPGPQPPSSDNNWKLQVRCPFDFSDKHANNSNNNNNSAENVQVRGLERISRHAGLWSLACLSASQAALQPALSLAIWWTGPVFIAWLGGMHSDSRFRRGMGGYLDPYTASQTSNVPFVAMLSGRQGSSAFLDLCHELKLLNAGIAALVATFFVASRGRSGTASTVTATKSLLGSGYR